MRVHAGKLFIVFSLLSFGLNSFAGCSVAKNTNRFYLGLQGGSKNSDYKITEAPVKDYFVASGLAIPDVKDKKGWVGRIYLGYDFTPYFSTELGYTYLNTVAFDNLNGVPNANADLTSQAGDLIGKIQLPLQQLKLFALGGVTYVNGSGSINSAAKIAGFKSENFNGARPIYGLGASLDITPHWTVDATWRKIPQGGNIAETSFFMLGVSVGVGTLTTYTPEFLVN